MMHTHPSPESWIVHYKPLIQAVCTVHTTIILRPQIHSNYQAWWIWKQLRIHEWSDSCISL